jgi:hypothetical protein
MVKEKYCNLSKANANKIGIKKESKIGALALKWKLCMLQTVSTKAFICILRINIKLVNTKKKQFFFISNKFVQSF